MVSTIKLADEIENHLKSAVNSGQPRSGMVLYYDQWEAVLKALRSSHDGPSLPQGYTPVRTAVLRWLHGEAAHPDTGLWFERPEGRQGNFWWRKELGEAELSPDATGDRHG